MIQYSVGMSLGPSSSVESGVAVREIATGKLIYVDKLFSMSDVQLFFDNYSSIQNSVFCISLPWDNTMMEGKWRVLSKPYQLIHENEDRFLNRDNWMQRFAPRGSELFMKLKEEGADIAGCDVKKVCETEKIKETEKQPVQRVVYSGREATANLYDAHMYLKSVVAWNKLYKKELFEEIRFPKGKLHEDEFTSYKLLYQSESVVYIDRAYYFYFQREDGIMGKEQRKISPAVLEAYEGMETFFFERGEKDLLQMMMYRYLSMVRRYASDAVKSGDEEEIRQGRYYEKKFRKDYRKYIWKIKKPKRKFRLWMYYHFKICV